MVVRGGSTIGWHRKHGQIKDQFEKARRGVGSHAGLSLGRQGIEMKAVEAL